MVHKFVPVMVIVRVLLQLIVLVLLEAQFLMVEIATALPVSAKILTVFVISTLRASLTIALVPRVCHACPIVLYPTPNNALIATNALVEIPVNQPLLFHLVPSTLLHGLKQCTHQT
jgi:hypothetical protein